MASVRNLVNSTFVRREVGYYCQECLWTSGMSYFYNMIDGDVHKPELFTTAHINIGKKIIEDMTFNFDHLNYNKDCEIIQYLLVKDNHADYVNMHNHSMRRT